MHDLNGRADTVAEVVGRYRRHLGQAAADIAEKTRQPVESTGEGAWITDSAGRRYLDCGGYGVFLLGHSHPDVVGALQRQLGTRALSTRSMLSAELALAAERLAGIAPPGLDYVYFGTSGAEAVETALKLGRATGHRRVICAKGGFHGKTLGALSITDRLIYQRPFKPLLPDVSTVPFGDAAALAGELAADSRRACVVLEPVQGEGGIRIPPPGYLREVRDACDRHGAMLVLDEVQTGIGRLGAWWGCSIEDVVPDVLLAGKGLGGGCMPVSAVIATDRAFAPINRNARVHSSTFGGSPLAAVAVTTTLDVIERDDLVARSERLGDRLLAEFTEIAAVAPQLIREVRGRGLLLGIECARVELAGALLGGLSDAGVIATATLGSDIVVRISPPAILSDAEFAFLCAGFRSAVRELVAGTDVRSGPHSEN
ncbi:aspartate aminotransferase family protein [Amycolatopsis sp. NPDC059021]|uniref:aspartate aminotransferase family protein n=1 Tax=Amycolatopsis sp. NPDC059021 TaxID=3346704 RepID=UPI00366F4DB5